MKKFISSVALCLLAMMLYAQGVEFKEGKF